MKNRVMKIVSMATLFTISAALVMPIQLVYAQDDPIPNYPNVWNACSSYDVTNDHSAGQFDPEWGPIEQGVILEGTVPTPTQVFGDEQPVISRLTGNPWSPVPETGQSSKDDAMSQISFKDTPWAHYTHDSSFLVIPDSGYRHLLDSYIDKDGIQHNTSFIEVEWENAANMLISGKRFSDNWERGAMPLFVQPSAGDRVWVNGQWIWDCGHGNPQNGNDHTKVAFNTEIHPPRAVVTFRLNVTGGNLLNPFEKGFDMNSGAINLPVTGSTKIPMTQADIFVSGYEGAIGYNCITTGRNYNWDSSKAFCDAEGGIFIPNQGIYNNPIYPVNDTDYIFDIYPPGTDYNTADALPNGVFKITPMTRDGTFTDLSLQWRIIDHSDQIPPSSCYPPGPYGDLLSTSQRLSYCKSVDPIIIPIDDNTPPPDQTKENGGPIIPTGHPNRLRVILPFKGRDANVFAKTILLGWDDVPKPPCTLGTEKTLCQPIRSFKVSLDELFVVNNGHSYGIDGEWFTFANIGGNWRFMSDPNLFVKTSNGGNACHGDELLEVGSGDCFDFSNHPWNINVQNGTPIHISIDGWDSNFIDNRFAENSKSSGFPPGMYYSRSEFFNLWLFGEAHNKMIGNLEFDLLDNNYKNASNWGQNLNLINQFGPPTNPPFSTVRLQTLTFPSDYFGDDVGGQSYVAEFSVQEDQAPSVPNSDVGIGIPQYTNKTGDIYITSATPLNLIVSGSNADPNLAFGSQYRYHLSSYPPPIYSYDVGEIGKPGNHVPIYWLTSLNNNTEIHINKTLYTDGKDGEYILQFSGLKYPKYGALIVSDVASRNTIKVNLDNTPPVINIYQPTLSQYVHSAELILNYTIDDGYGSGVKYFSPTLDGNSTLAGHGLQNGQAINLLTELPLGNHTFSIDAADNLQNADSSSVNFSIIVTADSIKEDVNIFLARGLIKNNGVANSLLAKLDTAAKSRTKGKCDTSANNYQAFINELQAQSGKGVNTTAAAIMIADADYLIAHCS
jgi:hypothetical protein